MIDLNIKAELEALQTKFIYAADRKDYEAIKRLYHPDAVDDHGEYKGPVDGYVEWLIGVQKAFDMSAHVLTNMYFIHEGDYAESEVRGTTYLRLVGEQPTNMIVVGRHFDKYERRNGAWKFFHRSLCVDWVQKFEPDAGGLSLLGAIAPGKMGKDDPFYSRLRLLPSVF